jgi:hypothetical protein
VGTKLHSLSLTPSHCEPCLAQGGDAAQMEMREAGQRQCGAQLTVEMEAVLEPLLARYSQLYAERLGAQLMAVLAPPTGSAGGPLSPTESVR